MRQGLSDADPTLRLEAVVVQPPLPRGLPRDQVEAVLDAIPRDQLRDRVAFGLLYGTGIRAGELLGLHVEDVTLTPGDERLVVLAKGGRKRTVLLDEPKLVTLLKRHLRGLGRSTGPVFVASRGDTTTALTAEGLRQRWLRYAGTAGVTASVHALRHSHATELLNGGVRLEVVRRRLGHANIASTLRYAELADATADAEIRAWRRGRSR